ncbi:MAG: murein transglycosylase A [Methylophilaceae bacterium]
MHRLLLVFALVLPLMFLGACSKQTIKPDVQAAHPCNCAADYPPIQIPDSQKPLTEVKPEPPKTTDYSSLRPAKWEDLDSFTTDDFTQAWPAWLQSCSALKPRPAWQIACDAAAQLNSQSNGNPKKWAIITYFKQHFSVYATSNVDGTDTGMITGYYEPLLRGSRSKTDTYRYPLYSRPDDLITVDLASVYPELANKRVRGKLVGTKLVPYYQRGEIETETSPLQGKEMVWIDDIVDVFFLQIQGSGLVKLENGEQIHVGYADQNGHAYNSIGKLLIDRGELTADKASMQGIKNWARNNLDKLRDLLNSNPSYVFFRELPAGLPGPMGALGVPILAERVVAVDPRFVPLGAPVFLATTYPNTSKPLNRLMMAQDTGGAIKGGVRADFFWGAGDDAARQAGAMKQRGKIWVLLPKEFPVLRETPANVQSKN